MSDILIAALTLGGVGVAALITFAFTRLKSLTGSLGAGGVVLASLTDIVATLVRAANQTLVDGLKKDAADGKITKEELLSRLDEVKNKVVADVKALIGSKLGGVFGWGEAEITKVIASKVEAQVLTENVTRNAVAAATTAAK